VHMGLGHFTRCDYPCAKTTNLRHPTAARSGRRLPDQRCARPCRLSFLTLNALEAQPLAELTVGPSDEQLRTPAVPAVQDAIRTDERPPPQHPPVRQCWPPLQGRRRSTCECVTTAAVV
jgi:hypothetical protein